MPTFLETVFGRGKKPTSVAVLPALEKAEADLASVPCRIAAAEATLKRVADLTDVEHATAEAELAAAKRSTVRLEAQIAELRAAKTEAEKIEASAALRARVDAARRKSSAMDGLLSRYDTAAEKVADVAAEIAVLEGEVYWMNCEIEEGRKAGLDVPKLIQTANEMYRFEADEPDHVTPDRTVTEEIWCVSDNKGRWSPAGIFIQSKKGEMVPEDPSAEKRKVARTIPGKIHRGRPGRRLPSPVVELRLPPSRLSGPTHWPRGE